jgi:hypothetical protein
MRLWTVHPRYLDAAGLVALWRETLLARSVLRNQTKGYRHHPQLRRFRERPRPVACINAYLSIVHAEAVRRGYRFDASKIGRAKDPRIVRETAGQLAYEWQHLMKKLDRRSPALARSLRSVRRPKANPMFRIVPGRIRDWEKGR